jgi:AbrB family looped-hinge helix DNA binding protein
MERVTVSSKGQVVIPKSLRDTFNIRTGDQFLVSKVGDELRFRPAPVISETRLESVAGMLKQTRTPMLDDAEIERRIGARLRAEDDATKPG